MIDTLAEFDALMLKYNVSSDYRTGVSNPLETPDIDHLFHGTDFHRRAYVNLPIVVVMSESRFATRRPHALRNGLPNIQQSVITVYQKYTDDKEIFALTHNPAITDNNDPLGPDDNDLTLVEKLLAGETIRFHEYVYVGGTTRTASPTDWIDVMLLKTRD